MKQSTATWHHISFNSLCHQDSKDKTKPHQLKTGYKFDGIVQDKPRWLVVRVCINCHGYYAIGFTNENPKKTLA